MGRRFRQISALTIADWRHVGEVCAWLVIVEAGVRLLGYARTSALLSRSPSDSEPHAPRVVEGDVAQVLRAFARVSRRAPRSVRCVARSLVLQRMLARCDVQAVVRIGVRHDQGQLLGHAWVELDGRPLGERGDPQQAFVALEHTQPVT